jgi:F0F1-type ATP synthase assembly protein I
MTEPNDTTSTRPISVAELLAKNGNIGAPSPGGRRRRRRGNADAVTVAELTGEIPIVNYHTDEHQAIDTDIAPDTDTEVAVEAQSVLEQPQVTEPDDSELDNPEPEAQSEPEPHHTHHGLRRSAALPAGGAEEMSPDPLIDDDELGPVDLTDVEPGTDAAADGSPSAFPSYLSRAPRPEDIDLGGPDTAATLADTAVVTDEPDELTVDAEAEPAATRSPFLNGVWIVAQSIFAVLFGAGLFVAFDQLWKWNNIVALVLSVLVILGLVVGVRVVRRTEDIASTLIAVAVGALVTLGPLALLQST